MQLELRFIQLSDKPLKTQLVETDQGVDTASVSRTGVAILMCTYNGAPFLREQLDSIGNQSYTDWTLFVSDDGSTDATRRILADYQQRWGTQRLIVFDGPRRGFGKNFVSLLKRAEIRAHHYAFSDQDDVWFSDKLERGLVSMAKTAEQQPSLYCSRTRLIDAEGNVIGFSPLFSRAPSFKNALVQSLAGANTMIMNEPAREILLNLPDDANVVAHDWLAYILVTATGGTVLYDAEPTIDYRQHGGNLIGASTGFRSKVARFIRMLSGQFAEWNESNLQILKAMKPLLTRENQLTLARFESSRHSDVLSRLSAIRKSGVYRQTVRGNISLIVAACLGRI